MTWHVPLTNTRHVTLISASAPTLDADPESKDTFYASLNSAVERTPPNDKLILLWDFNARVGSYSGLWLGTLGQRWVGGLNDNGLRLLSLCSEHQLIITNTLFQLKDKFKTSWQHPRSKHWHLLDYIITRRTDRKEVLISRAMRGADCWTDHRMIRAKFQMEIRPQLKKTPPNTKLNCEALKSKHSVDQLRAQLATNLSAIPDTYLDPDINTCWNTLRTAIHQAAEESLGYTKHKHQDRFDNSAPDIHKLLQAKHKAHAAYLANPQSITLKTRLSSIRAEVQRTLRAMENDWWIKKSNSLLTPTTPMDFMMPSNPYTVRRGKI